MASSELLRTISANKGSIAEWRAQEDALHEAYQARLRQLREDRKEAETHLTVAVLQAVNNLYEAGLGGRFRQLYNLTNGLSGNEENFGLTLHQQSREPLVPIKPFFDVARELEGTTAGFFLEEVFASFQKKSRDIPKSHIRVIGVESGQNEGERLDGIVMLCDNNRGSGYHNHIGVGFDVFYDSGAPLPRVVVRDGEFLSREPFEPVSLTDRFAHMLLSEEVVVIGALFIAADRAVTQALQAGQAGITTELE